MCHTERYFVLPAWFTSLASGFEEDNKLEQSLNISETSFTIYFKKYTQSHNSPSSELKNPQGWIWNLNYQGVLGQGVEKLSHGRLCFVTQKFTTILM